MTCERVLPRLEVYLDGELPLDQTLEVEEHLGKCPACQREADAHVAMSGSIRHVLEPTRVASVELRSRVSEALAREVVSEKKRRRATPRPLANGSRHTAWGLAAAGMLGVAAAAALLLQATKTVPQHDGSSLLSQAEPSRPVASDEILDEIIDLHSTPPTPQITEPSQLPLLERDVGVRVSLPAWEGERVAWQGASVVRIWPGRAAYLRYRTTDGHGVTMYVYDSTRIPVHAVLRPRIVSEEPVYVGNRRGYSIAARTRQGIGYAVATDLDSDRSVQLLVDNLR